MDFCQDLIQSTLRNTVLQLQTSGDRNHLQCEPWTTLKSQDFKAPRSRKYDGFIPMVKGSAYNMKYVRQWLEDATEKYEELRNAPEEKLAKLVDEADIRFCLEYHHTIFQDDSNAATLLHQRKLRELGYGHSGKKKPSTTVSTPQNQESRQSVIYQQNAAYSGPSEPQRTHKESSHCPPKPELEVTRVSKVVPGGDVSPPAKKQKKGPNLEMSTRKTASDMENTTELRQSRRGKGRLQPALSNNDSTTQNDTSPQIKSARQARPQTNEHTNRKGTSAQYTVSDISYKRKAPEDAVKSSSRKRFKKSGYPIKPEVDSSPVFGLGVPQIDSTLDSGQPQTSSISASLGSVPVVREKKRKLSTRHGKIDPDTCNTDALKETTQLPSIPCRTEPQCLALAVDNLPTQKLGNSNDDFIVSLCPEHNPADMGVVTLCASLQPASVITEEQPHIITDKTLDVSSDIPGNEVENEALQTAISSPPTQKEGSNMNIYVSTPENITSVSGDHPFVTLTPSSTPAVSNPPLDALGTTIISIPTRENRVAVSEHDLPAEVATFTPSLTAAVSVPPLDTPDETTLLTFDPVYSEDNLTEGLSEGFGPSSSSHLLHDIGMTDIPIAAASELTIEESDVPHFPRPPLVKYPPIWSESRQELCESFDWFRSYQGGVYFTGGAVKGYLLSAFGAKRDFFKHDGKFIVSHGGGRAESLHSTKGNLATVAAGDQLADDKSVRALRQNYLQQRPLALVIDEKYPLFPHELTAHMNVTYAVLGFYTIAHMWAEYQNANNEQGRVVRYKFAFRWCDSQGAPWWTTPNEAECPANAVEESPQEISTTVSELIISSCLHCKEESKQVYSLCWVCLNPDCRRFWRQSDGSFLPEQMSYHPGFLTLPPSVPVPLNFKLNPVYPIPSNAKKANAIVATAPTSYPFTRGFHCTDCGRLSCRSQWARWECLNCHHSLTIIGKVRRAKEFWGKNIISTAFRDNYVNKISGIKRLPVKKFDMGKGLLGDVQTFILPHGRGEIHHLQPGSPLGSIEADKIFEDYQAQAANEELLFRRWPLRAHKCRGTLLTNYFSQNTGQPYQYVGGDAHTVPFESAPSAIVAARDLLQTRVNRALGRSDAAFNEILSAAYMEKQKMAFHSDNEAGLGPLVAGLSMGAAAMMHFRLHAKHDPERRQRGIALSFTLRHGDILVMDGSGVQEFYEHTVVPTNFRIAATARQITPAHH